MGNYLTKNERFHLFSKSPVSLAMSLDLAVNKAGHIVSASDIWASDIPWFIEVANVVAALNHYSKNTVVNDHIKVIRDAERKVSFYKRNSTPQTETSTFDDLWIKIGNELPDKYKFYPRGVEVTETTKPVVIYHKDVNVTTLTTENNIADSQGTAGRIWITDESGHAHVIEQFVTATDKIVDGQASTGYNITVKYLGAVIPEDYRDDATRGYVSNAFAGIIYYNNYSLYSNKCTASVFEYVGDKLEHTIKSINGIVGDKENRNITIKYNKKYHGSSMIDNDVDNNAIIFNPAQSWQYNGVSFGNVVKFENGICFDKNGIVTGIVDDTNLTKGKIILSDKIMPQGMFMGTLSLKSFIGDLSNLTDGSYMFMWATSLETFIGDLGKMTNGKNMFMYCDSLENVNTDLSSLEDGTGMFFGCTSLTPESIDLIIDMLPTYPIGSEHPITISNASDDQIEAGRLKGWKVTTS